jgi:hypothetical protein
MENRQIVRVAYLRSTLHLITRDDHERFRPVIQPALVRGLHAFFGQKVKGLDIDNLLRAVQPFLQESAHTMGEIRSFLLEIEPERDPDTLAYAVRTYLPLVQVPPSGTWGSGSMATYTSATNWLIESQGPADLPTLLSRYLAAFGPASLMDFQTWTGMTNLKNLLEPLRTKLISYKDEQGRELLDLPDMPIPDPDIPAPVRFIPEYDNLLIAHADRSRIIANNDRPKVFLSAGRVLPTILVDGFVRGTWKLNKTRHALELSITLFTAIGSSAQDELMEEAEALLQFIEPDMADYKIRFVS